MQGQSKQYTNQPQNTEKQPQISDDLILQDQRHTPEFKQQKREQAVQQPRDNKGRFTSKSTR